MNPGQKVLERYLPFGYLFLVMGIVMNPYYSIRLG